MGRDRELEEMREDERATWRYLYFQGAGMEGNEKYGMKLVWEGVGEEGVCKALGYRKNNQ